ncbi:MAG: fasciclin domain-containing protein, partial [Bacteroidales bacterium]|nr:fasciclin domain-containing protein [Bacteroidales bacterium]
LSDGQMASTVNGKDIKVTINEQGVFINDAKVTVVDLEADNGVVHVIDMVLLPEDETTGIIQNLDFQLNVYPNPASDYIYVTFEEIANEQSFSIIGVDGKIAKRFSNVNSGDYIDLTNVDEGTYFLINESDSRNSDVKKIIILR